MAKFRKKSQPPQPLPTTCPLEKNVLPSEATAAKVRPSGRQTAGKMRARERCHPMKTPFILNSFRMVLRKSQNKMQPGQIMKYAIF